MKPRALMMGCLFAATAAFAQHGPCDHDHDHGVPAAVQVREAEGGTIVRHAVFPAEIRLNRDRMASVSPRYASVVREVFAEIGDQVEKGDPLALLENRETLASYPVVAPLGGTVVSKDVSVGETAEAGSALFEVADLATVWADVNIFPPYRHLVRKGMPVDFFAGGQTLRGVVGYASPIASRETRTFTARCVLEGGGEFFAPGVFVRARMAVQSLEVPVRVPREAVQMVGGGTVVFVPHGSGFDTVAVETGLDDGQFVEIVRGLNPGDRFVAAGAFALKAEILVGGLDPHAGHGH